MSAGSTDAPRWATLRTVWLILRKDVLVELRTREVVATMVLFATLVVVIFAFAFDVDETRGRLVGPGIVWTTILFAGTIGLGRVFDRERDHGCLTGLLLLPGGPKAVYIAKAIGLLVFVLITELLTIPLMLAFVGTSVPSQGIGIFVLAVLLGTIGFVAIGTLFGAMLSHARLRDVLVPLVVYPVVVPVIIGGVKVTADAMNPAGGIEGQAESWLQLMTGFDLIFVLVPPWLFGRVMVE